MARVNKANFRTYRDGETVTASEFNKIKDIFPEAINHIEDTLRDGQRLVDIENVNKEQDERLDSHDEQQAQTDQHLEQLDTRCDEQDEVLADHESRITTATSENSRQDEVIHNINERLREVEDNNADIKIVTVFANNIQKVETFVASEGQQEFQLQKGHYIPGQNRIQMFVDGVQQTLDDGFMEVGSRTIRFTEPLKVGMKVTAHYFTEEASDDLTDIMETIKEGPAILEGLIQNGESSINGFIQNGENTINGFLAEGEREVEELVTKGENAFDNLVQRAEQVKADSILVQSTKPLPSDNCDIWFDTSEDDFLTLQDYEEARNQAFNNQMATFESRFSEIKGEKGDKGEPGVGVLESDFKDYMGDVHETLRAVHKANVEYTVRTAVGEFNHLDYEGQHITANHSIEGHVKSAILKGQTLVNMCDDGVADASDIGRFTHNYTGNGGTFEQVSDGIKATATQDDTFLIVGYDIRSQQKQTMAIGKKYYGVADVTVHNLTNSDSCKLVFRTNYPIRESTSLTNGRGLVQCVFTHSSVDANYGWLAVGTSVSKAVVGDSFTVHSMSVYEITEEEVYLSYEELANKYPVKCVGMQSVKMPVLTTTGKNLFDGNFVYSTYVSGQPVIYDNNKPVTFPYTTSSSNRGVGFVVKVKPNTKYTMSIDNNIENGVFIGAGYSSITDIADKSRALFHVGGVSNTTTVVYTFTTPNECHYMVIGNYINYSYEITGGSITFNEPPRIQLEEGTQATSFEDHKSNILTCNEPIELGKVGNVEDELNLLTGEVVESTEELIITGNENFVSGSNATDNTLRLQLSFPNSIPSSPLICDKFKVVSSTNNLDEQCISIQANFLFVRILKSNLGGDETVQGCINYIKNNNFKIRYIKSEKVVKTVVLSDNVVYSYDEVTHYDGSSESGSLVPTVAVKVPTDVQAVITDQSATIQTLEQENQTLKKTQDTLLVVQLGMMEHMATTLAESEEQPTYIKALRQLASERGLL